jgi:hypothetical protein
MPQQICHNCCHLTALEPTAEVLGEVRAANLRGCLYPHPRARYKRQALRELRHLGLVDRMRGTATSIGGWFARERGSATLGA